MIEISGGFRIESGLRYECCYDSPEISSQWFVIQDQWGTLSSACVRERVAAGISGGFANGTGWMLPMGTGSILVHASK